MRYGEKIQDIQIIIDAYKLTFKSSEYSIERLIEYHKKLIAVYVDEYIPGIFFQIEIILGPLNITENGVENVKMLAHITFENDTTYPIHINNWHWINDEEEKSNGEEKGS